MFKPNIYKLARKGLIGSDARATQSFSWARSNVVIISRALCAFERIRSNPDVSTFKRRRAAELQARLNSPFDTPGLYLTESGTDYIAWTWDATEFEKKSGLPSRFGIPETAGVRLSDGVHLLRSIDGFEGCLVRDGELMQSRWWPHEPTEGDWRLFLASARERFGETDLPSASIPHLNANHLTHVASAQPALSRVMGLPLSTQMSWLSLLILPIAAFICVYLLAGMVNNQMIASEVAQMEEALADKRATANQLRRAQTQAQAYAALSQNVSYLLPISTILEKVDGIEGDARSIRIFDNQMEFVFRHSEAGFDPVSWVRELENDPLLSDVSIVPSTQRQEWVIEAQIATYGALPGAGQ